MSCASEPLIGASSSRSRMKRRCVFIGSLNRNVWFSRIAQSLPNACADMHSTSARALQRILDLHHDIVATLQRPLEVPDAQASARSRSARARTAALSCGLWLRNTSYAKSSAMRHLWFQFVLDGWLVVNSQSSVASCQHPVVTRQIGRGRTRPNAGNGASPSPQSPIPSP